MKMRYAEESISCNVINNGHLNCIHQFETAYLWCGLLGPEALLPTLTSRSSGSGSLRVVSSVNLVSSDRATLAVSSLSSSPNLEKLVPFYHNWSQLIISGHS